MFEQCLSVVHFLLFEGRASVTCYLLFVFACNYSILCRDFSENKAYKNVFALLLLLHGLKLKLQNEDEFEFRIKAADDARG